MKFNLNSILHTRKKKKKAKKVKKHKNGKTKKLLVQITYIGLSKKVSTIISTKKVSERERERERERHGYNNKLLKSSTQSNKHKH